MRKILLIGPKLGSNDVFIRDLPLSLLYASVDSVKSGFEVKIIDLRVVSGSWQECILKELTDDVILVGISVMTGFPIKSGLEISRFIKNKYPAIPIVWGGPHPTVEPESTIEDKNIDFLIRGYGSLSLCQLAKELVSGSGNYDQISGLSYKTSGIVRHNPVLAAHELISFKDIPYQLIDIDWDKFQRFDNKARVFPIFTSFGCNYNCAFCISPTLYSKIQRRWIPFSVDEIMGHIELAVNKYGADYISVTDDDSFVDLARMRKILEEIKARKLNIIIGFRGARINELDRMDGAFLQLMQEAGVRHFAIGVESGSQKVLNLMRKGITVEQVIRVNRKLAQFPKLVPLYNIMSGIPGETLEDLMMTKSLMLRLVRENPQCLTGVVADFKPIPGSELYDLALKNGFKPPASLEAWGMYDSFDSYICHPWYKKSYKKYLNLMQVSAFFIDNKILKEVKSGKFIYKLMRFIVRVYKPVIMFRLRHNWSFCLFEYKLMKIGISLFTPRLCQKG